LEGLLSGLETGCRIMTVCVFVTAAVVSMAISLGFVHMLAVRSLN